MENNSFSHVLHRTANDPELRKIVNSFPHSSRSARIIRPWSRDISENERFVRKRKREDDFVQKLDPEDRPILLVKDKHVYKDANHIKDLKEIKEREGGYHKVTTNTTVIESTPTAINNIRPTIRKNTVLHAPRSQSATSMKQKKLRQRKMKTDVNGEKQPEVDVYKIDGLEFLPEGFLELEPLLYHDEFTFMSEFDRRQFLEEQKRLKNLRVRQYHQKKFEKMRNVTIFVVNEYKDNVQVFLEHWYNGNKRRMTPGEMTYVAQQLDTTFEKFSEVQEVFLKKKKNTNAIHLKAAIEGGMGLPKEKLQALPSFLRPYFHKSLNDTYSDVSSRYMDVHKPKEVTIDTGSLRKINAFGLPGISQSQHANEINHRTHLVGEFSQDVEKFRSFARTQPVHSDGRMDDRTGSNPSNNNPIGGQTRLVATMRSAQQHGDFDVNVKYKIRDVEEPLFKTTKSSFETKTSNRGQHGPLLKPAQIDELERIFEDLERSKGLRSNIEFQKKPSGSNCDIQIDQNYGLMNCRRALDLSPSGPRVTQASDKQSRSNGGRS
jgi:hypothetical protein